MRFWRRNDKQLNKDEQIKKLEDANNRLLEDGIKHANRIDNLELVLEEHRLKIVGLNDHIKDLTMEIKELEMYAKFDKYVNEQLGELIIKLKQ